MQQSENIAELARALNKVQAEKLFALLDKTNPFFNSKYADLSSVWAVAREPLIKNGLSITQLLDNNSETGNPIVVTQLMHSSGQWVRGRLELPLPKKDPQAMGSCITYGRRYSLAAALGICPDDDDGNYATGLKNGKKPAPKKTDKKPTPKAKGDAVQSVNCTQEQFGMLVHLAEEAGFQREELNKLVEWYRKGEKLSKSEASDLIDVMGDGEKFGELCENYAMDQHAKE